MKSIWNRIFLSNKEKATINVPMNIWIRISHFVWSRSLKVFLRVCVCVCVSEWRKIWYSFDSEHISIKIRRFHLWYLNFHCSLGSFLLFYSISNMSKIKYFFFATLLKVSISNQTILAKYKWILDKLMGFTWISLLDIL